MRNKLLEKLATPGLPDPPRGARNPDAVKVSKYPNRLRFLRESFGLEQQDAARTLGIDKSTLNRHEQGNRSLDGFTIQRYAEFYGVSPYELFVEKDHAVSGNLQPAAF